MVLFVNTWLGYPLHDAAGDGIDPIRARGSQKLRRPRRRQCAARLLHDHFAQIIPLFLTLLIAPCATNFNNLVLIFR